MFINPLFADLSIWLRKVIYQRLRYGDISIIYDLNVSSGHLMHNRRNVQVVM